MGGRPAHKRLLVWELGKADMLKNGARDAFAAARRRLLTLREDQAAASADFEWPELTSFNWALDWFDAELAARHPEALALKIIGEDAAELSFGDLSAVSNRIANGLRAFGLRRGDRILLMLGNCPALWEIMLAAMKLGAVTVPTTTLCTPQDVRDRLDQAGARFIVTTSDLAASLDGLPESVIGVATGNPPRGWTSYEALRSKDAQFIAHEPTSADDPILLYFTSGTTARPKLVVHSHRSYGLGSLSTMYWLGLQPGDRHLNVSSPGWAKHAWSCLFAPWNAGASVIVANEGRFNAHALLRTLVEHDVSSICAPPTVWRMLIQEDLTQYSVVLRNTCSAGEPLNPEVVDAVRRAWRVEVRDGFGQTETTAQIGNAPGQPLRPGSVGRPLPGYRIALLDADGAEVSEGEIALRLDPRPAALMCGYLGDDGALQAIEGDYYRTGDVASRDADGWYTYVGRADDVFKASDYRLSPFELESALLEHPAVMEAAVVPAPDPVRQAVPKAYIALASGFEPNAETAQAIFAYIQRTLAPYKRIRRLEFSELSKTISGKIRRIELRRWETERFAAGERGSAEYREDDQTAE